MKIDDATHRQTDQDKPKNTQAKRAHARTNAYTKTQKEQTMNQRKHEHIINNGSCGETYDGYNVNFRKHIKYKLFAPQRRVEKDTNEYKTTPNNISIRKFTLLKTVEDRIHNLSM